MVIVVVVYCFWQCGGFGGGVVCHGVGVLAAVVMVGWLWLFRGGGGGFY